MRVVTIGGGPAGLYFALLLKKSDPRHEILVLERNGPDESFGWGVVFSDQTLGNLEAADAESYRRISESFVHWDDIDIHVRGTTITSGGHGFSGISRRRLLAILRDRAAELGVELRFRQEVRALGDLQACGVGGAGLPNLPGPPDLIVAADGVNSLTRAELAAHFEPDLDVRRAKYLWLGTKRLFEAFTFIFVENEAGVFQAHAYRFDERTSAFIVECDEESWRNAGFDRLGAGAALARCEEMFAPWLAGNALEARLPPHLEPSPWSSFVRVRNARWYHDNVVLIGDAAHTAHFSIGSGTKLAMEDAIALAKALGGVADGLEPAGDRARGLQAATPQTRSLQAAYNQARGLEAASDQARGLEAASDQARGLEAALGTYQAERMTEALRLQNAARNSMEWFENVKRYIGLAPAQLAYSLLTRSQRVSHENLRRRDRVYLGGVERWFAERAGVPITSVPQPPPPPPPMFTPFSLRGMTLANRVVVAPMDMYSAEDGLPNDFHLVHLGARALGGAGLVITEMTCVSREGRISPGCAGMYSDEHAAAWRRVTDFVHRHSPAKICLQLGHSGAKGATRLMWEGMDEPLAEGGWPVMAASAVAYRPGMQVPREMSRADMERVKEEFVRSGRLAATAGFDMLELHCAHGYLLSGFLTPLGNRRTDDYGGLLANRLRYPLEVFAAVRAVWPADRPMSVRISATDWVEGGLTGAEAVAIARAFHAAGADIIHVSAGQTSPDARPVYGRMFQTPLSDRIRNEAGAPTIAVGNITEPDQVNSIIAAGRADLCALARPHLADPQWTLRAAAELGFAAQSWPNQYLPGKVQLERQLERRNEMLGLATV